VNDPAPSKLIHITYQTTEYVYEPSPEVETTHYYQKTSSQTEICYSTCKCFPSYLSVHSLKHVLDLYPLIIAASSQDINDRLLISS